jgi:steroid delta-isomerase-like uncharacterized protein
MSTATHKKLVTRLYEEAFVDGNLSILAEIFAADVVDHTPIPGQRDARSALEGFIPLFRAAFSGLALHVPIVLAEDDAVAAHYVWTGTHAGPFFGVPATGRAITVHGSAFFKVRDGKLSEHWGIFDLGGLMAQIGPAAHRGS